MQPWIIFQHCFKHSSFYSEIFVICWIESVDPVADLCLTNQIYSAMLNAFEFKEITEVQNTTLKCFLKMAKRALAPGRWRMKGDETRPRGCKYPTAPCALAKILPETTMRAYFSQIENDSPTTNIHFLHSQQIFFVLVCKRAGNPRVPPRFGLRAKTLRAIIMLLIKYKLSLTCWIWNCLSISTCTFTISLCKAILKDNVL